MVGLRPAPSAEGIHRVGTGSAASAAHKHTLCIVSAPPAGGNHRVGMASARAAGIVPTL